MKRKISEATDVNPEDVGSNLSSPSPQPSRVKSTSYTSQKSLAMSVEDVVQAALAKKAAHEPTTPTKTEWINASSVIHQLICQLTQTALLFKVVL